MTTYKIRLKARIAKPLDLAQEEAQLSFQGQNVTLRSSPRGQQLADSSWFVFEANNFPDQEEARRFGEHLRAAVLLAGLAARLGVDTGQDLPGAWFSGDQTLFPGLLSPGQRPVGDVHGLMILPDDNTVGVVRFSANLTILEVPSVFFEALTAAGKNGSIDFGPASAAMRLMNVALINPDLVCPLRSGPR